MKQYFLFLVLPIVAVLIWQAYYYPSADEKTDLEKFCAQNTEDINKCINDKEFFQKLYKAGFRALRFGVDAFSKKYIKITTKRLYG